MAAMYSILTWRKPEYKPIPIFAAVERTWLRLRLEFGDTAVLNFNQGVADGRYNSEDPYQ